MNISQLFKTNYVFLIILFDTKTPLVQYRYFRLHNPQSPRIDSVNLLLHIFKFAEVYRIFLI